MSSSFEQARDRASRLFLEHYELVRSVAFHSAPVRDCQEDIIQDAFVNFVSHADRWNLDENVRPLLTTITQNAAKVRWHQHIKNLPETLMKLAVRLQKESEHRHENDEYQEGSNTRLSALEICLGRLSERSRLLIEGHYVHGVSVTELAQQANIKENTLHQTMSRIRKLLRQCVTRTLQGGEFHDNE